MKKKSIFLIIILFVSSFLCALFLMLNASNRASAYVAKQNGNDLYVYRATSSEMLSELSSYYNNSIGQDCHKNVYLSGYNLYRYTGTKYESVSLGSSSDPKNSLSQNYDNSTSSTQYVYLNLSRIQRYVDKDDYYLEPTFSSKGKADTCRNILTNIPYHTLNFSITIYNEYYVSYTSSTASQNVDGGAPGVFAVYDEITYSMTLSYNIYDLKFTKWDSSSANVPHTFNVIDISYAFDGKFGWVPGASVEYYQYGTDGRLLIPLSVFGTLPTNIASTPVDGDKRTITKTYSLPSYQNVTSTEVHNYYITRICNYSGSSSCSETNMDKLKLPALHIKTSSSSTNAESRYNSAYNTKMNNSSSYAQMSYKIDATIMSGNQKKESFLWWNWYVDEGYHVRGTNGQYWQWNFDFYSYVDAGVGSPVTIFSRNNMTTYTDSDIPSFKVNKSSDSDNILQYYCTGDNNCYTDKVNSSNRVIRISTGTDGNSFDVYGYKVDLIIGDSEKRADMRQYKLVKASINHLVQSTGVSVFGDTTLNTGITSSSGFKVAQSESSFGATSSSSNEVSRLYSYDPGSGVTYVYYITVVDKFGYTNQYNFIVDRTAPRITDIRLNYDFASYKSGYNFYVSTENYSTIRSQIDGGMDLKNLFNIDYSDDLFSHLSPESQQKYLTKTITKLTSTSSYISLNVQISDGAGNSSSSIYYIKPVSKSTVKLMDGNKTLSTVDPAVYMFDASKQFKIKVEGENSTANPITEATITVERSSGTTVDFTCDSVSSCKSFYNHPITLEKDTGFYQIVTISYRDSLYDTLTTDSYRILVEGSNPVHVDMYEQEGLALDSNGDKFYAGFTVSIDRIKNAYTHTDEFKSIQSITYAIVNSATAPADSEFYPLPLGNVVKNDKKYVLNVFQIDGLASSFENTQDLIEAYASLLMNYEGYHVYIKATMVLSTNATSVFKNYDSGENAGGYVLSYRAFQDVTGQAIFEFDGESILELVSKDAGYYDPYSEYAGNNTMAGVYAYDETDFRVEGLYPNNYLYDKVFSYNPAAGNESYYAIAPIYYLDKGEIQYAGDFSYDSIGATSLKYIDYNGKRLNEFFTDIDKTGIIEFFIMCKNNAEGSIKIGDNYYIKLFTLNDVRPIDEYEVFIEVKREEGGIWSNARYEDGEKKRDFLTVTVKNTNYENTDYCAIQSLSQFIEINYYGVFKEAYANINPVNTFYHLATTGLGDSYNAIMSTACGGDSSELENNEVKFVVNVPSVVDLINNALKTYTEDKEKIEKLYDDRVFVTASVYRLDYNSYGVIHIDDVSGDFDVDKYMAENQPDKYLLPLYRLAEEDLWLPSYVYQHNNIYSFDAPYCEAIKYTNPDIINPAINRYNPSWGVSELPAGMIFYDDTAPEIEFVISSNTEANEFKFEFVTEDASGNIQSFALYSGSVYDYEKYGDKIKVFKAESKTGNEPIDVSSISFTGTGTYTLVVKDRYGNTTIKEFNIIRDSNGNLSSREIIDAVSDNQANKATVAVSNDDSEEMSVVTTIIAMMIGIIIVPALVILLLVLLGLLIRWWIIRKAKKLGKKVAEDTTSAGSDKGKKKKKRGLFGSKKEDDKPADKQAEENKPEEQKKEAPAAKPAAPAPKPAPEPKEEEPKKETPLASAPRTSFFNPLGSTGAATPKAAAAPAPKPSSTPASQQAATTAAKAAPKPAAPAPKPAPEPELPKHETTTSHATPVELDEDSEEYNNMMNAILDRADFRGRLDEQEMGETIELFKRLVNDPSFKSENTWVTNYSSDYHKVEEAIVGKYIEIYMKESDKVSTFKDGHQYMKESDLGKVIENSVAEFKKRYLKK